MLRMQALVPKATPAFWRVVVIYAVASRGCVIARPQRQPYALAAVFANVEHCAVLAMLRMQALVQYATFASWRVVVMLTVVLLLSLVVLAWPLAGAGLDARLLGLGRPRFIGNCRQAGLSTIFCG
jgi:hypothetical protein